MSMARLGPAFTSSRCGSRFSSSITSNPKHLEARLRAHPDALRRIFQRVAHGAARSLHHPLDPGPQRVHVRAVVHRELLHDGRERSFAAVGAAVVFVLIEQTPRIFVEGVVCREALRLVSGRVVGSMWYRSVQNLARPSLLRNAGKPSVPSSSTYSRRSNFKPLRSSGLGRIPLHHVAHRGRRVTAGGGRAGDVAPKPGLRRRGLR